MHMLVRTGFVFFLAASAVSTSVHVSSNMECVFKDSWSTGSEDLFELAHSWSKSRDVQAWSFSNETDGCSRVSYESNIHVPNVFSVYWRSHSIKLRIEKLVCVRGQSMRETLKISQIPFMDDVAIRVSALAHAETAGVSLGAEYAVAVPWYLAMIDAPVQEHVRKSVLEYLDLLKSDICAR